MGKNKEPNIFPERLLEELKKEYVVVDKTRVSSWHAWLLIGLAAGITAGIIFVANNSGEFGTSRAATFAANDRVTASQKISVQSKAGGGKTLGAVDAGDAGSITAGPTVVLKKNWWKVKWDKGIEGWSQENLLKKSAAPSNPSSSAPANCANDSPTCTISFPNAGVFPVSARVTDSQGRATVASAVITVGGGGGNGEPLNCSNHSTGINDTLGATSGDGTGDPRFLCSLGQWYTCGWYPSSNVQSWDIFADYGQHVGSWYCDLYNARWQNSPLPPDNRNWAFCANGGGGQCSFDGTHDVRYGASGGWFIKNGINGNPGIRCDNATWGDPIQGRDKHCDYDRPPDPRPRYWTFCARAGHRDDSICRFSGTRDVRYGENNSYIIKPVTNEVFCNNETFGGDPLPGQDKHCDYDNFPAGTVQGMKVLMPGNQNANPPAGETVTLEGIRSVTDNPYTFSTIPAGRNTVTASFPSDWSVGYTLCINRTDCHGNNPTPGHQVQFDLPANQFADLWWHYTPPANQPKGTHDSSNTTASTGWACDSDDYNQPLTIHFYKDGPAGVGTFLGAATASQARESAVGDQCGGNSNHGFSFPSPDSLKDGNSHTVYAYALNIGPAANNPLLSGSPKTIAKSCQQNPISGNNLISSVTLQSSNGQFVSADQGGCGAVLANRSVAGSWETFTLSDLNGGLLIY